MKNRKIFLILAGLLTSLVSQAQAIDIVKHEFEEVTVLPFVKVDALKGNSKKMDSETDVPISTKSTLVSVSSLPITSNLVIKQTDRLMPALKKWLADQNVELVWAANAQTAGRVRDVVFEDDFESSSSDIGVALTEVLSPFGFEAEISTNASMRRVTVRNLRGNL